MIMAAYGRHKNALVLRKDPAYTHSGYCRATSLFGSYWLPTWDTWNTWNTVPCVRIDFDALRSSKKDMRMMR